MDPSVSVVIPSFNHEAYVGLAIDSVLASTRPEIEVVVIDDGSTDASRERLDSYRGEPRVRLHFQENRGAHAALNTGCRMALGRWIFILNSDDTFDPSRVEILTDLLEADPEATLAASWVEVIDGAGDRMGVKKAWRSLPPWAPPSAGPLLSSLGDPRLALLETNWISTTSNIAFPATLVRDHGLAFTPLRYAHDWDFILSACRLGVVELVDEPLVQYRVHGANTIGEGVDEGQGLMRFEIMWVVARHAARLLRAISTDDAEFAHLHELLSNSAPTFGCDAVFDQLLLLRGGDETSPAAFEALIEPGHPFTRAAVGILGD